MCRVSHDEDCVCFLNFPSFQYCIWFKPGTYHLFVSWKDQLVTFGRLERRSLCVCVCVAIALKLNWSKVVWGPSKLRVPIQTHWLHWLRVGSAFPCAHGNTFKITPEEASSRKECLFFQADTCLKRASYAHKEHLLCPFRKFIQSVCRSDWLLDPSTNQTLSN